MNTMNWVKDETDGSYTVSIECGCVRVDAIVYLADVTINDIVAWNVDIFDTTYDDLLYSSASHDSFATAKAAMKDFDEHVDEMLQEVISSIEKRLRRDHDVLASVQSMIAGYGKRTAGDIHKDITAVEEAHENAATSELRMD